MPGEPILVVDDTPVNLKLTRILLTHEGYEVRTANGGEEALEILESFHPRLVLADIQMPGMDGFEMTRRIKADPRHRDIVVVALTALAMQGDEQKALDAGCDGYITKPIDTRALGDRIRAFLHDDSAPGVKPSAADLFAEAGIDDLRSRFLDEAMQQVPIWIEQLEGAFDPAAARLIAHQWVGSAGLLGYRKVSMLSREVETVLRQRPLDMAELRGALDTLLDELQEPGLADDPTAPPEPADASARRHRVLLADDDPNIRALIKAFLESQNVECRTAADGSAAVGAILEAPPDAVVLDVNMPEMNGYEVLESVRRQGYRGKVFLLTADEHPETGGVDDFLVKPFDPVELVVRLTRLGGGGSARRRPANDGSVD
jgi:CheY-like chemotaxis protein